MKRIALVVVAVAGLASCKRVETERETGHKGLARVNPYLAAERFLEASGHEVRDSLRWPDLDEESPSMIVMPFSVLRAEGFVNELRDWVDWGGHAVLLLDHAESHVDDWDTAGFVFFEEEEDREAALEWLRELQMEAERGESTSTDKVSIEGTEFEVWMESTRRANGDFVATREVGYGRVTVLADARPLRNRWIGDHDHAALLSWLAEVSPDEGPVLFLRFASISFWGLLWERAWPAVVGLIVLILVWLWKNLPRFGPLDSGEARGELRAADHHLEALGGFHWQMDRARALLHPLRESLMERGQRLALATGQADANLFELMGERAGIGRERAERAMLQEVARDSAAFTRLTADLQLIHQSLP